MGTLSRMTYFEEIYYDRSNFLHQGTLRKHLIRN